MFHNHLGLLSVAALIGLLLLPACDASQPVMVAGMTLRTERQTLSSDKSQPMCHSLENAGYIMPYGPSLSWYDFRIIQKFWMLNTPDGSQLSFAQGEPTLFVLVNWSIPANMEEPSNGVSQETVDVLADEARNICRIVQQEARNEGIGPVAVTIRLWDLVLGDEIDYGRYDSTLRPPLSPTSDCDQLTGELVAHSSGSNPVGRTSGLCPSLYVPN